MDPDFNWINLAVLSIALGLVFGFIGLINRKNSRTTFFKFFGIGREFTLHHPERIKENLDHLMRLMEKERLYRDPELTLAKLSRHADISPELIIAALNYSRYPSFDDFVNSYRANEVIQRLDEHSTGSRDILSIALESGFQSHATFQRVFKNITGMSPRDYKSSHSEKVIV